MSIVNINNHSLFLPYFPLVSKKPLHNGGRTHVARLNTQTYSTLYSICVHNEIQYTRPKILDHLSVVIAYIYHPGQGDIPDVIMNQGGANLIKDLKGSK